MSDIANTALKYLGTPFVHQGRSPNGLDCVGLLVQVAKDLEFEAEDFTAYSLRPSSIKLVELLRKSCRRVEGEAQTGDILIFELIGKGWPQHAAIKTVRGMVHSYRGGPNKVIEVSFDDSWRDCLHSVWRYKEQ
tara:strand:+ start:6391 stop:6792 length:402 start_codon:yes stop_codon:yes gene_type:complete